PWRRVPDCRARRHRRGGAGTSSTSDEDAAAVLALHERVALAQDLHSGRRDGDVARRALGAADPRDRRPDADAAEESLVARRHLGPDRILVCDEVRELALPFDELGAKSGFLFGGCASCVLELDAGGVGLQPRLGGCDRLAEGALSIDQRLIAEQELG